MIITPATSLLTAGISMTTSSNINKNIKNKTKKPPPSASPKATNSNKQKHHLGLFRTWNQTKFL